MLLAELQHSFSKHMREEGNAEDFLKHLQTGGTINRCQRLQIYQESIREGLANALRETYPVCEKLVGEDFFTGLSYEFIAQNFSVSPSLFDYGESFADFVAGFAPATSLPYLPDVCRLEWAYHRAYYAENPGAPDWQAFAELSEDAQMQLQFQLQPGSVLMMSAYPVDQIWRANQEGVEEKEVSLHNGGVKLLVYRRQMQVKIMPLSDAEYLLLSCIEKNQPLDEVCAALVEQGFAGDLSVLFSKVASEGWVSHRRTPVQGQIARQSEVRAGPSKNDTPSAWKPPE